MWTPLNNPQPGDWLYENKEDSQCYGSFTGEKNVKLIPKKKETIYIQPIKKDKENNKT